MVGVQVGRNIYFYPRSPCGERLISPHSAPNNSNFYPRSPCGERRQAQSLKVAAHNISIHALLAESDSKKVKLNRTTKNFYPRSPCGERRVLECTYNAHVDFYPRSPCGERRVHYDNYNLHCVISIHALLAESDTMPGIGHISEPNFYPRSPCGERR